jgi:phage shock protein PspC (stress-responsive transcriptional regulator)
MDARPAPREAEAMTDTRENQTEQTPSPGPRRLLRSRDDRVALGVAGGLANYLRVDPTLVRVGFVIATFFGGFGLLAYVILALVVPTDDGSGRPERRDRPSIGLIVAAVILLLVFLPGPFWGPWDGGHWGGWWAWGGGWLLLIGLGALCAYLLMRGRDRDEAGGDRETSGPAPSHESARADAAASGPETATTAQMSASGAGSEVPTASQPARPSGPHPAVRAIGIVLIALVALCAVCSVAALSAWAVATGNGEVAAAIVIALGAGVVAAAASGSRVAPWLILPALVVALPAGAMAASDIRFDGDIGERSHAPSTAAEVPGDGYRLGVGQLIVDLRELEVRPGQTVDVTTDLGIGQTIVSVPADVCLDVDAEGSAGELYVRGERSEGVDLDLSEDPADSGAPRIALDADVDVGQLLVSERPPEELDDEHGDGFDDEPDLDDSQERASAEAACER